ncbi:MAG TPA: DUF3455 domain-containing protein [Polyangiaceae bacterium]
MPKTISNFASIALLAASSSIGCAEVGEANGTEPNANELATEALHSNSFPSLPDPSLAVPEGNSLEFYLRATGVQIYACQAASTGFAWTFQAPEASLVDRRGHVVVKHYGGPTWEYLDGSKVVASKVAGFTDDATAIPELLLAATTHEGDGRMSDITYIQRLDTHGGLAPTDGCDAVHVGSTARIDYTATYYFYRAKHASCGR